MYKQEKTLLKSVHNFKTYIMMAVAFTVMMYTVPVLNQEIYAQTRALNPNYEQPALLKSVVGGLRTKEYKEEQEEINLLYDLLEKAKITKSQYDNLKFEETKAANQAPFTFGTDEALNVDTRELFARQGKLLDPVGNNALHDGRFAGYSASELVRDPGVFCIDRGTPLGGEADDSRGRDASKRKGTLRSYNYKFAEHMGSGNTENARLSYAKRKIKELIDSMPEYVFTPEEEAKIEAELLRSYAMIDDATIQRALENLADTRVGEGNRSSQSGSVGFDGDISNKMSDYLVFEILKQRGYEIKTSNDGEQYAVSKSGSDENKEVEEIEIEHEGTVEERVESIVRGGKKNNHGITKSVLRYEAEIKDDEAYLAYIVSSYQERKPRSTEEYVTNSNELQYSVWNSAISESKKVKKNTILNNEADDFQKYWTAMREFERNHTKFPDDGYQRLLKGKNYHYDVRIKKSYDSQNDVPDEEILIKNPRIKYEPRILPGANSTMEDSSVVNFDTNTQKWLIGPYKVDYLMAGSEQVLRNENTGDNTTKINKYFSGITKVVLKGEYTDGNGATRRSPAQENLNIQNNQNNQNTNNSGNNTNNQNNNDNNLISGGRIEIPEIIKSYSNRYHYSLLNPREADLYNKINAYVNRPNTERNEFVVKVSDLKENIFKGFTGAIYDNPELDYLPKPVDTKKFIHRIMTGKNNGKLQLFQLIGYDEGISDKIELENIKNRVDSIANNIVVKINTKKTLFAKVMEANNGISDILRPEVNRSNKRASNFLVATKDGVATERAYALLAKYIFNKANVPSIVATAMDDQNNKRTFNLVYIDGKWYAINIYENDLLNRKDDVIDGKYQLEKIKGIKFDTQNPIEKGYLDILAEEKYDSKEARELKAKNKAQKQKEEIKANTNKEINNELRALSNATYVTEEELVRFETESDKWGIEGEERRAGLSDVKAWRLKIKRNRDAAQNGPGMNAQDENGEYSYGIPAPNEEFFFEIDYDPALLSIKKARFEFAYMIFGGARREYYLYSGNIHNIKINLEESGIKLIKKEFEYGNLIEEGYVPDRINTGIIKIDFDDIIQQQQTLMSIEALRWIEEIAVEINFKNKNPKIPETPKLKLMVPIAGRVWEDRQGIDKKHVGYDNLLGTDADINLKGISVTVFRNFVKFDEHKRPVEILSREYARLFDENGKETGLTQIFTDKDGKYGPYYLHDIGFTKEELEISKKDTKNFGITYDVRFDYDGMYYEPVLPLQSERISPYKVLDLVKEFNMANKFDKKKLKKASFAYENKLIRERFNKANATIAGQTKISDQGNLGKTIPVTDQKVDHVHTDSRQISYRLGNSYGAANGIERVETNYNNVIPEEAKYLKPGTNEFANTFMHASTMELGLKLPANEKIRFDDNTNLTIDQAIKKFEGEYLAANDYMKNINFGVRRRKPVNLGLTKSLNNAIVTVNKKAYNYVFKDIYPEMATEQEKLAGEDGLQIDLNQVYAKRDNKKIDQFLDLYKTDYIYRTSMYSQDKELMKALAKEIKEEQDKDTQSEGNKRDPRQLDVYITYRLNVINNSPVDTVMVNAVDDYYNNKMELVNKSIKKQIEIPTNNSTLENTQGLAIARKDLDIALPRYIVNEAKKMQKVPDYAPDVNNTTVNKMETIKLEKAYSKELYKQDIVLPEYLDMSRLNTPITLRPDETADIYLTFRVKNAKDIENIRNKSALGELNSNPAIKQLTNSLELGEFENIAEIARFTTYDALTGKVSAKFDETSAPDNIDVSKVKEAVTDKKINVRFDDDVDSAPIIRLQIPEVQNENTIRKLNGIIWEDKRNAVNNGIVTGDGQFDANTEKGIAKMPVTLEERISIHKNGLTANPNMLYNAELANTGSEFVDIPFIWPGYIKGEGIELDLTKLTGFESTVETNNDGIYEFKGIPAGNMVVSLDYTSQAKDGKKKVFESEANQNKNSITAIKNSPITNQDLVQTINAQNREVKYYNGMDFKNTMFYALGGNTDTETDPTNYENPLNLYKTWLDKNKEGVMNSYLRDDEGRRLEITATFDNMQNENLQLIDIFRNKLSGAIDQTDLSAKLNKAHKISSMRSTTPKLNFSIEHYEKIASDKDSIKATILAEYKDVYAVEGNYQDTGTTHAKKLGYDVKNINLGLVERPKTKVVLNKEVENISLTTSDGKKPIDIYYNTIATVSNQGKNANPEYGKNVDGEDSITYTRTVDTAKSVGTDFVLSLDRTELLDGNLKDLGRNKALLKAGFRYINIDKALLQDAKLSIKYGISAYNLGEIDRKIDLEKAVTNQLISIDLAGNELSLLKFREKAYRVGKAIGDATLNLQINPDDYGYGAYVGLQYYMRKSGNGQLAENELAKTTIKTVMDLVDNSTEVNKEDLINKDWVSADINDLLGKIQNISTDVINSNIEFEIVDGAGERYIQNISKKDNTKSNVFITKGNFKPIKPFKYDSKDHAIKWEIKTDKLLSGQSDKNDLVFENIAEILEYNSGSGRADYATAGNVILQLDVENENGTGVVPGNNKIQNLGVTSNNTSGAAVVDRTYVATTNEYDSASTETVTLSEPTGLGQIEKANNIATAITVITTFIVIVVISIIDNKKKGS